MESLATLLLMMTALLVSKGAARELLDSPPAYEISQSSTPSVQAFEGDGTAYSAAVANGVGFACSFRTLSPYYQVHFAAMNKHQWNSGLVCGKCISVKCIDPQCKNHDSVILKIVDECPECKYGDVDLSIPAYDKVTGLWPNRLKFQWDWTPCPPDYVQGDIKMFPKAGSNKYWKAFYFSNARYPIAEAWLDGIQMKRQQYNFWTYSGETGSGPHKFTLKSSTGETVEGETPDLMHNHTLNCQFS